MGVDSRLIDMRASSKKVRLTRMKLKSEGRKMVLTIFHGNEK
jgi:hypothetical protein